MAGKSEPSDIHATLCSSAAWTNKPVSLRHVTSELTLPTLAQVVTGKYRGIVPADSKHHHHHHHHHHASSRRTSSVVFIQSIRTSQKVLMEAVKVQPNGRHVESTGHNYSMPLTYGGWFEVLSEDGKAIEPVSTVAELATLWPPECVVREAVRAIVCSGAKHDNPDQLGTTRLDQTRTVMAGEWLALRDVVEATVETTSHVDELASDLTQTKQYLRCVDAFGDSVFLAMNQRALLSPVAGPYNISGVHSVQSLLDKFRLPLIVRLVCGVIPTKLEKTFTSVFRLIGVYEDETAFILPLQTSSPADARMLSVSTREPLVFVAAANIDELRQSPAFTTVESRCSELVRAYMSSIHVLVAAPDTDALARGNQLLRDTQDLRYDESLGAGQWRDDDTSSVYDEIDDIYRYVRQGGEPPAPRPRLTAAQTAGGTSTDTGRQQSTPATHVASEHNAADYNWEEPIYEDIEKIRQRKRQRATATETTTETTARTTTTVNDQEKRANVDVLPIGNLRQLIKRFSMIESPTSSSKQKPKPVRVDRAPPVPPKLTVDVKVTSPPPADDADVELRQQVDVTASQPVIDDNVRLDVPQDSSVLSAEHVVNTTSPAVCHAATDWQPAAGADCVTSIRVSHDVTPRRHQLHDPTAGLQTSAYYCSRVSVGAGSLVRPAIVDTSSTVTRITTLSRQSARRRDLHQTTA